MKKLHPINILHFIVGIWPLIYLRPKLFKFGSYLGDTRFMVNSPELAKNLPRYKKGKGCE